MFAPTTKYEKISGAFALDKSNFCFYVVLLVALVWLCGSFAEKCGKANKSSRKCAGKKYFLSEDLTRAAELKWAQQFAVFTGTKYGRATTDVRFLEKTIREASGNSGFLRDFLQSWMP